MDANIIGYNNDRKVDTVALLTNVPGLTEDNLEDYDKISFSEMDTLLRCKRKWKYQYLDGFEQASTPGYFAKGTYLHKLMAFMLDDEELEMDEAHQQVLDSFEEDEVSFTVPDEEVSTLRRQAEEVIANVRSSSKEILGVEQEFYVDLGLVNGKGEPVLVHGFIDAHTLNSDSDPWVLEWKTAGRAWSADQFNFHVQDDLYALSLQTLLDQEVRGGTYVFFLPNRIEYRNVYYTRGMFEAAFNMLKEAVDMRDSLTTYPMEPLWGCGGCPFQAVCRAELSGQDPNYMLTTQFIQNQDRVDRANMHREVAQQ